MSGELTTKCQAMILTRYIGGKARCKRTAKDKYCYHHQFLNTFTGYRVDRYYENGVVR